MVSTNATDYPALDGLRDARLQGEGLIATKIGRIRAGDPNHADHWHDIAGYARLVGDMLG